MGLLITLVLGLFTACASTPKTAAVTDESIVTSALDFQNKRDWAGAEREWNKLSPQSVYFSRAFYETQKLSYRLEDWRIFFAKTELYRRAFHEKLYCPELYLLQAFAYTRNCLFNDADKALTLATQEIEKDQNSQCSRMPKAEMKRQVSELMSVMRANQKLMVAGPIEINDDPLKRNLWPVNAEVFKKIQTMPLEQGLSLVGVEVKNKCGS